MSVFVTFLIVILTALAVGLLWGDWVGSRATLRVEEKRRRMQSDWGINDPRWEIYDQLMAGEIGPPIR